MSSTNNDFIRWIENGHCASVPGFSMNGVACDIRGTDASRLDIGILFSPTPCSAAGVFTRNRMAAAPVAWCRQLLAQSSAFHAIVVNSGNANACTGADGKSDTQQMAQQVATELNCPESSVFVASTGRIGRRLPMTKIQRGIRAAAAAIESTPCAANNLADAILTSDTRRKQCAVEITTPDGPVRIAGIAKGAGMIEPNMATMLAFIVTDAKISNAYLQELLQAAVKPTFNAITVDGDESTNDSVIVMANGASGIEVQANSALVTLFAEALQQVCFDLARKIVGDGEKISKVVTVRIENAASAQDAEMAARAVANSLLVKSSWYGNDPNWGRVLDAVGYSGAAVSEDSVQLWYATEPDAKRVPAFEHGKVHEDQIPTWKSIVREKEFCIIVSLGQGSHTAQLWSTDLTEGYVNFNKSE